MVKIVNQHCDLGLALLLAWTWLTRLVVAAHLVDIPTSSRLAAEREEQQLSRQDVGRLSYQSIHRMLRTKTNRIAFGGIAIPTETPQKGAGAECAGQQA